jgi:gluconate 5-dehydrogenase
MKHVLITGGSDGLGKITAGKLIEAGFSVTILSRDVVKTKAVAAGLGCGFVTADVSDYQQVDAAVARSVNDDGPIDILINNAGLWIQDALDDNDPAIIRQVMEVNALGTIYCTRSVVPSMKERKSGRIISVISQAGLEGKAERAPYNASKWAVTGFVKSMQAELKPFNIAVDGFYPGAINKTGLFDKAGNGRDMSRGLDPAVAAEALVYLCKLPEGIGAPEFGILSLSY